jgi:hypothetical protein
MNVFLAKARGGELDFGSETNQARLAEFLKKHEGETLRLELPKKQRTVSQNKFYWLYLGIIEQETGNGANDLHDFFKMKLLPKETVTLKGKKAHVFERTKSTTKLNKQEMSEYMEKICAMTGVPIPDPQEAGYFRPDIYVDQR